MRPSVLAAALWTCSSILSGCAPTRVATALRPDKTNPERFICQAADASARPRIPSEYAVDWATVGQAATVPDAVERAKAEFGRLLSGEHERERMVANYVLEVEGRLFTCSANMQWQRDFYAGL